MSAVVLSRPGTLVRARGREWVVLPDSTEDLLVLRPLGGLDEETTGIIPDIEKVESATFPLPTRDDLGDFRSGRLLRDAARLSTRAAAGPFRSFARIAVEPRPYQLVPLMMALRLDPVRLLIADDVGIGKTIEAAMVAREMLDRNEIKRIAVLCPPHLAEQWQKELAEKFHIDAELVLSGTIQRLERDLPIGKSVFDRHRFVIVSTDFIKSSRRAADFELKCPEFVIVDEAHGCTLQDRMGRGRQQRFDLVSKIAADPTRHIVLVTATPHSGNEGAFRTLLSLLDSAFADLPEDLTREERDPIRRKLARHLVQRRRADIRHYLDTDTAFPERLDKEETYSFSREYRELFNDIVTFARELVSDTSGGPRHQRVRYWSALALLRCVSSSPEAAAATLRSRAAVEEADETELDEVGRRTVLDQFEADETAASDLSPGAVADAETDATRRRLLAFARRASDLTPAQDNKLQGAIREVKALIKDGFQPIVFCRFVDTADYIGKHLRAEFRDRVNVGVVTGLLPPDERESRIGTLIEQGGDYVLVCTDCLSEGVNLQQGFNAVLHYDLCWNPTRHEQREGRVDRFGQSRPQVRVITYYGSDNPIDGVILDVLIRKHKRIKSDLGVTVAVPGSSETIAQTLFEGALFREMAVRGRQLAFDFGGDAKRQIALFHAEWDNARDRERASRSRFAQRTLDESAVAAELRRVRDAIGRGEDVARFVRSLLQSANVPYTESSQNVSVHLTTETPRSLRQAMGRDAPFKGRFDLPLGEGELYLGRTSPVVEGLAGWTMDHALDSGARDTRTVASRCGVIRTSAVAMRTTLLLIRFRYRIKDKAGGSEVILCEDIAPLACTGPSESPKWLSVEEGEKLLGAVPEQNLIPTLVDQQMSLLMESLPCIQAALTNVAGARAAEQLDAHERVREAMRTRSHLTVEPVLPVDILGAYVLLPRL